MILDTNVYSALANGTQSATDIITSAVDIKLPLPVIAELRYGFVKGTQQTRNEQMLLRFISQPQVSILIPSLKTTKQYAIVQLFCQKQGKALSQNDIWIAALASEISDSLITFDRDFIALADLLDNKLIVLE